MTNSTLDLALDFIDLYPTRYLFPLRSQAKFPPLVKNNLETASNDPAQLKAWHDKWPGCNWGLALRKSNLFVVDTDRKDGKVGQDTHETLDMLYGFPATETVISPTNGLHEYYNGKHEFGLGKHGLGADIDSPNYVLIAGCEISIGGKGSYRPGPPMATADAPEWFYEVMAKVKEDREAADQVVPLIEMDLPSNVAWAIDYLKFDATPAVQGQAGDAETVNVAANMKDHGISQSLCVDLMAEHYNPRCEPPWSVGTGADRNRLDKKVENAYRYLKAKGIGEDTAEADFAAAELPDNLPKLTEKTKEERAAAKRLVRAGEPKPKRVSIIDIADEWVYVLTIDRFVHRIRKDLICKAGAFDRYYMSATPKGEDMSTFLLKKTNRTIRKFIDVAFAPGKPEFYDDTFNFYRPSDIVPAEGDTSFWDAHLKYLFPDDGSRNHVLNWCGWFLQNLKRKPKHALIIAGYVQGTGKTFIPNVISAIIGSHNVSSIGKSELTSDFNRWAARSKLLVVEELRAAGIRDISHKLHPLISETKIPINDKGHPTYSIDNVFGMIGMTNNESAIHMDKTDRRYLIVRTEAEPSKQAYYDRMYTLLEDKKFIAAVAHQLMTRDLGSYNGQAAAPLTFAKREMIQAGLVGLEEWLENEKENAPFTRDLISIHDDILPIIPPHLAHGVNPQIVGEFLRRQLRGKPFDTQHRVKDGRKVRLWALHGKYDLLWQMSPKARVARYEEKRGTEFGEDDDGDVSEVEN